MFGKLQVRDSGEVKRVELFHGIYGRILTHSDKVMLVLVEVPSGFRVPAHKHPHEQLGYCLKGEAEFISKGKVEKVREGMAYLIPSNEEHEVRVLGEGSALFLDVFSPARDDYLKKLV